MKKKKQTSRVEKNQEESEISDNIDSSETGQEPTVLEEDVELISDDDEKATEDKSKDNLGQNDLKQDSNKEDKKDNKFVKKLKTFFTEKKYRPARIGLYVGSVILILVFIFGIVFKGKNPFEPTRFKIVSVRASKIENYITANDSTFLVKTEGGSLEEVKKHLYLEPALDYEISEKSQDEYELKLANQLADNLVFNIDYIENEIPEYKWAFQTKKELSISKVYPADGATYVNSRSAVQVAFSYSNINNFEDHFSITPEIRGTFSHSGNVWTFTPIDEYASETTYTVTISAGLRTGEKVLPNDYKFSFSTHERSTTSTVQGSSSSGEPSKVETITLDKINTFLPSEKPRISLSYSGNVDEINKIEFFKINDSAEYIKYLEGKDVTLEPVGEKSFTKDGDKLLTLNEPLAEGYYVAYLKDDEGNNYEKANIQINAISAYVADVQRDAIIWVAQDGELKADKKVWYKGAEYKTNENGIAKLEDISDFSDKIGYATIENGNCPLIIGLKNFKNDTNPNAYIYTDRPLYKPTDTINIWGFVPLSFFQDKPNRDGFSIQFDKIKQDVEINSDGTFMSKISLNNYKDVSGSINLSYNDVNLASKYINVENYNAKTYTYKTKARNNHVRAGENYEFDIYVEHITGLNAVNKEVMVTYDKKDYFATTDSNGLAHFVLPTSPTNDELTAYGTIRSASFEVASTGSSYDKWTSYGTFYIIESPLEVRTKYSFQEKRISFTANKIEIGDDEFYDPYNQTGESNVKKEPFSGKIQMIFSETKTTKYISGYEYNNYTKTNEPKYDSTSYETILKTSTEEIVNGALNYDFSWITFKENTDMVSYSYRVKYVIYDNEWRRITGSQYFYDESSYKADTNAILDYGGEMGSLAYSLYEYALSISPTNNNQNDNSNYYYYNNPYRYSIGDTVDVNLIDKDGATSNHGKILEIVYKEKVVNTDLKTSNDLDIGFSHDLYPGSNITAAYFLDGRFYRMPTKYLDYDETDSELTISIETEKDNYEPGEEVRGKIIVKDKDGNSVDVKLNISVVNEGVFNMINDSTDFLKRLYIDKYYDLYTYSSYRNFDLYYKYDGGGKGGGGGGTRSNFGDTIYFEELSTHNGEANLNFKLNDEITSFRITVHAVTNSDTVMAGVNYKNINSYLPLSINSVKPVGVKPTDDLVLNASAITGENVQYSFEIDGIDKKIEAHGGTNEEVYANFGKLPLGTYHAKIFAQDGDNKDGIEYNFDIIESSQEVAIRQTVNLQSGLELNPAKNPINIEIYNENTSTYVKLLDQLSAVVSERLDTKVAFYKSREFKNKYYKLDEPINVPSFDSYIYDGAARILENAAPDLVLTGLLNYYAKDYLTFEKENFKVGFDNDYETAMKNYFVLASYKEPILDNLQYLKGNISEMSDEAKLLLGLSFAFLGDYDSATYVEDQCNGDKLGTNNDLHLVLLTFVSKEESKNSILEVINTDPSSDYFNFAILSFFENYNADISKEESVTIQSKTRNEEVKLNGVTVEKLTVYDDELNTLKFTTDATDLIATYYYLGYEDAIEDSNSDIGISVNGELKKSNTIDLEIDISKLSNKEGIFNIAFPDALKYNKASFQSESGLYVVKNSDHFLKVRLYDNYKKNKITIPVYLATPGTVTFEKIVLIDDNGGYHLSNDLVLNIKE